MVVKILDDGIAELSSVISGEVVRRPVNKVDWQNIKVADNVLLNSNGRPIFLYDYFSKSVGRPLTETNVYNDHLGAILGDHRQRSGALTKGCQFAGKKVTQLGYVLANEPHWHSIFSNWTRQNGTGHSV